MNKSYENLLQAGAEQGCREITREDILSQGDNYKLLAKTLDRAFLQAACGKGHQRHNPLDEAFEEQVMQDGAKRFGVGALLFQAYKKAEESQRLPLSAAVHELLGGIVYLAGAVIALESHEAAEALKHEEWTAQSAVLRAQRELDLARAEAAKTSTKRRKK